MKVASRADRRKVERPSARIYCLHNVEHKQDFVQYEVNRLGIRLGGRLALPVRKYVFLGRRPRADRYGNVSSNSVQQPLIGTDYTDYRSGMKIDKLRYISVRQAVH